MGMTLGEVQQLDALLTRLLEWNDEIALGRQRRLADLGSAGGLDAPDHLWPANLAVFEWRERQRKRVIAGRIALWEMAGLTGINASNRAGKRDTWSDPASAVRQRFRDWGWRDGRPDDASLASVDEAACQEQRCPHCGERLSYRPFTREENGTRQYRAFGCCGGCGLVLELPTAYLAHWQRVMAAPAARAPERPAAERKYVPLDAPAPTTAQRQGRISRPARVPLGPPEPAYFDHEVKEWFRKTRSGYHMLVTGESDASPPQTEYAVECPACASTSLHSRDYHHAQLLKRMEDFDTTIDAGVRGRIIRRHGEPVSGPTRDD